jgi:hypothetical protein
MLVPEAAPPSWKQKLRGWKIWAHRRAHLGGCERGRVAPMARAVPIYAQAPVRPFSARCRV